MKRRTKKRSKKRSKSSGLSPLKILLGVGALGALGYVAFSSGLLSNLFPSLAPQLVPPSSGYAPAGRAALSGSTPTNYDAGGGGSSWDDTSGAVVSGSDASSVASMAPDASADDSGDWSDVES